jgi:leucine dehydrogenase
MELLGWDPERASKKVDGIYDTILTIYETAKAEGISTNKAADRIAENHLRAAGGQSRREAISW